jgi:hypothetical protein
MSDQPMWEPLPPRATIAEDTDRAITYTREARENLSADEPEDRFYLLASARLAEVLRAEHGDLAMGRALMSVAQGLGAIEENLAERGHLVDTSDLLDVLSLAAEQLDREDAEAGDA